MSLSLCSRLAAGLLSFVCATACSGELTVVLREQALVQGARYTLDDLAEVSTNGADAPAARALGAQMIGPAPLVGQLSMLSRNELDLLLQGRAQAAGHTLIWAGAQRVRIRSAAQELDSAVLLAEARAHLAQAFAADGTLEASLITPLPVLAVPTGLLRYQGRLADPSRLRARMAVWVDVMAGDTVYRSVLVPLAVTALRPVLRARRPLPAGALVSPEDVALEKAEVAALDYVALAPAALGQGGRLRQPLAAGQVLAAGQLMPTDVVMRGDRVRLVVQAGSIAVETSAYAQADAQMGQQIRVRPEHSNETVMAIVTAPATVSVGTQRQIR